MPINVDWVIQKTLMLDPEDKLRRSLLERIADLWLCPRKRKRHYEKRLQKEVRRIGY
jgi:hypothetical protein